MVVVVVMVVVVRRLRVVGVVVLVMVGIVRSHRVVVMEVVVVAMDVVRGYWGWVAVVCSVASVLIVIARRVACASGFLDRLIGSIHRVSLM